MIAPGIRKFSVRLKFSKSLSAILSTPLTLDHYIILPLWFHNNIDPETSADHLPSSEMRGIMHFLPTLALMICGLDGSSAEHDQIPSSITVEQILELSLYGDYDPMTQSWDESSALCQFQRSPSMFGRGGVGGDSESYHKEICLFFLGNALFMVMMMMLLIDLINQIKLVLSL